MSAPTHQLRQARLRAAARAQLMRWLKPKTKRSHKEVPEIVKQQWDTGNKNDVADILVKCNFDKDLSQTWWASWLLTICICRIQIHLLVVLNFIFFLCLACGRTNLSMSWQWWCLANRRSRCWSTKVGTQKRKCEPSFTGVSYLLIYLEHTPIIISYICHFRWPYTPTSKFNSPTPRARIDGAKSRCKSLGPSHYRPGVLSPWFGMIWCVTLKLLWDPWVASMKTDMLLDLIKYSMQ